MVEVMKAEWKRNTEMNGRPVSEVEVWVSGQTAPWSVYLERTNNGYTIHQILKDDADYSIDWFDNDLHQAFRDISYEAVPPSEHGFFAQTVAELSQLQAFAK